MNKNTLKSIGAIFVVGRGDILTMQMAAFTVPDQGH